MSVYVDDMHLSPMGRYGRMKMCHMIADTDEELHAMANKIGVDRRWWQAPPKHQSHYDIAMTKRTLAIQHGAQQITMRQGVVMLRQRRGGEKMDPIAALEFLEQRFCPPADNPQNSLFPVMASS